MEQAIGAIEQLSTPFDETLAIVRALRDTGNYLLATINNESRELNEYRIVRFDLRDRAAWDCSWGSAIGEYCSGVDYCEDDARYAPYRT